MAISNLPSKSTDSKKENDRLHILLATIEEKRAKLEEAQLSDAEIIQEVRLIMF